MVMEILRYKAPSAVLELEQVVLEPELSQKQQFAFLAEIVDSQLMAETFYRLHRITKIKIGRTPGHETRVRYSYDPIITVENGFVDFETFSLDMTYYARARFYEDAFKNVEHWDCGVTNVDFSPSFIKQVRSANKLRNIFIDPEGLEVLSDTDSLLEKKIPLPENWKIGLQTIQDYLIEFDDVSTSYSRNKVLERIPFNPYLRRFAKVTKSWVRKNGWQFVEMKMRNSLGRIQIAVTPNQMERIDGRKNINYQVVRNARQLRTVKSYYLDVKRLDDVSYRVSGGREPHLVRKVRGRFVCDCGDYVHRHNRNCKHIRAINRPEYLVVQVGDDLWRVSDEQREYIIKLQGNNYSCECPEFRRTNICPHLAEVLKLINDYQFKEVKLDFS
jgi:hypothetical protein